MKDEKILELNKLSIDFKINNRYLNVVDNLSFSLYEKEVLAIVGESGAGKSTLANSILGLHNHEDTRTSGEILYKGNNLLKFSDNQLNSIRGREIGLVFQNSSSTLNPLLKIGKQVEESLLYHKNLNKKERLEEVIRLLKQVEIHDPEKVIRQFPHELSLGMKQRVLLAIALSCKPKIIVADEATSSLDVNIESKILDLLNKIKEQIGLSIIFISHDLGLVAQIADRVAVMYAGQFVEIGDVHEVLHNPLHPYTRTLLRFMPQSNSIDASLDLIYGNSPSLEEIQSFSCRFAPRIPWIADSKHEERPLLHKIKENHFVRCTCWEDFHFSS